jgi:hypothetical protein
MLFAGRADVLGVISMKYTTGAANNSSSTCEDTTDVVSLHVCIEEFVLKQYRTKKLAWPGADCVYIQRTPSIPKADIQTRLYHLL